MDVHPASAETGLLEQGAKLAEAVIFRTIVWDFLRDITAALTQYQCQWHYGIMASPTAEKALSRQSS